jgi:hypothetical protein
MIRYRPSLRRVQTPPALLHLYVCILKGSAVGTEGGPQLVYVGSSEGAIVLFGKEGLKLCCSFRLLIVHSFVDYSHTDILFSYVAHFPWFGISVNAAGAGGAYKDHGALPSLPGYIPFLFIFHLVFLAPSNPLVQLYWMGIIFASTCVQKTPSRLPFTIYLLSRSSATT